MEDKSKPKKFIVKITEILEKEVEVSAHNEEDAEAKVEQMYQDADIVLSAEDFVDYNIEVI